jgi:hypothetical protein
MIKRMFRLFLIVLFIVIATDSSGLLSVRSVFAQRGACPGAPALRLQVGGKGRLTVSQGEKPLPLRVRDVPGTAAKVAGQLLRGIEFKIISGPECKDGYAWWQIVGQGVVGWIAEGDDSGYFVEPVEGAPISQDQLTPVDIPTPTPVNIMIQTGSTSNFATFNIGEVDTTGTLAPYQVSPDLSNVIYADALTPTQMNYLNRNAFVISAGNAPEFYTVYNRAYELNQSQFITVDSLLHSYHLAFDKILRSTETQFFSPLLISLNRALLPQVDALYQQVKGSDWEDAARRTVAFVATDLQLMASSAAVPDYAADLVNSELANINNAGGIGASAIFPELDFGEDWSQYIARGHYSSTETLSAYFRAMMYYGRMSFRLSKTEETKSALLLMAALHKTDVSGRSGEEVWNALYEPTSFFAGSADSLTVTQYREIMNALYGTDADIVTIATKGIPAFVSAAQSLPAPKVLSMMASSSSDESETRGLRFMGQRFAWDAYAFSQLIYDRVGSQKRPRGLPSALDLFAAFGSDRALQLLDKDGATGFDNYSAQMQKLRQEAAGIDETLWTSSLSGAWLSTLNTMAQPVPVGYPAFMVNVPYQDRLLYAALGSYTELKHDTVLYAEQANSAVGAGAPPQKGPPPQAVRPPSYVEPVPLVWARLAALAELTESGLSSRRLISTNDSGLLKAIADLARVLQKLSVKELHGEALTDDEQAYLSRYGSALEGIVLASADVVDPRVQSTLPADLNAAVATDITTDPARGRVLQIATGQVFDMLAVVPINGKLYLAHGGTFSFYEFTQPLANRLTDEGWLVLLSSKDAPTLPDWSQSFVSPDSADSSFIAAIRQLQENIVDSLWTNPTYRYGQLRESTNKVDRFIVSQIEPLAKARQYERRTLLEFSFRGMKADKDGKTMQVTTRETWQGELHNSGGEPDSDGPKIGERGPYTVEMIYTFTKDQDSGVWTLAEVTVKNAAPRWKNVS